MRKRRAFADPELNYATLLGGSACSVAATATATATPPAVMGNAFYDLLGNAAAASIAATTAAAAAQNQQLQGYQSAPLFAHTPTTTTPTAKKPKLSFSIESIIGINT